MDTDSDIRHAVNDNFNFWVKNPLTDVYYQLNEVSALKWYQARKSCQQQGGDLLSVTEPHEQAFISGLTQTTGAVLWTGLHSLDASSGWHWVNGQPLRYLQWLSAVHTGSCTTPWIPYSGHCYHFYQTKKTWLEARHLSTGRWRSAERSQCRRAELCHLTTQILIENAFLVSLIGARSEKHFWIGLSNQKNKHIFEWTNTSKVSYTHFNAEMPGGKQGCVAMTTGVLAGLWDVLNCSNAEKYICKQKAEGVTPTPAHPTTPPANCSEGWFPLRNRDQCAKIFSVVQSQKKTWFEALAFCRELGGDLLSIHSSTDLLSLESAYSESAWIGYSIQDPTVGYTWSDGSDSSFEDWQEGEPNNLNNIEKCAIIQLYTYRTSLQQWNDLQCDQRTDWLCEIQKGVAPKNVQITEQTYNKTDDGWIIFKESQYYMGHGPTSVEEGRRFCKHRHGDLVVINDEEERLFVWHQSRFGYSDVFIGMKIDLDKSLMWMDGSPVVFQAWEQNQPAFENEEEDCVKMTRSQGLWESVNCGDYEKFICERSGSVLVNSTAAPTEPPQGDCAPDWFKFQNKCYKRQLEQKTWYDARDYCKRTGGNLVSITHQLQQAFLTLKMVEDTQDLWIGFSNLANRRFKWTDGSPVKLTSFLESGNYYTSGKKCVAMGGRLRSKPGKWVEKDCNDTSGFICSRPPDTFVKSPDSTELPKTFITIGNASYLIVQTNLTWGEAKQHCESQEAKLASIRDLYAQYYIELQANKLGQPMWIGLNSQETDGYFLWIDNWQLNMEKWHYGEPKKDQPCVYVDEDGRWKTAKCNNTYYSLCKKSTDVAPTPPTQYPGVCPEQGEYRMTWVPFRGHCYGFVFPSNSWVSASKFCSRRGASLVSIQDTKESAFLENYISFLGNIEGRFWIGLYKTFGGHWLWTDNSVVDYTNWDQSGDSRDDEDYYDYRENYCAFISATTKKWGKQHCRYSRAQFICKIAKVNTGHTVNGTAFPAAGPNLPRSNAAAVSVVVVIVVLSVLAGLAYIYNRNSKRLVVLPSLVNPLYYATGSSRLEEKDTKFLVDNNE
ncbi:macrophage mannose receptor 1-like [Hoplias malabaricus]|uniref:macrophage mannose receptor 1-like n=1 Tax=Hoplias malabaricus TaxID=27720 RepID=UPI00346207CF